jgi:group I intron endonuclease
MWVIYKATNQVNNKVYIGQARDLDARKKSHKYNARHKQHGAFYAAIRKHGWDVFTWEILQPVNSQDEANEAERYWIAFYRSTERSFGYNILQGGTQASHTPESLEKMRWSQERRARTVPLIKARMSSAQMRERLRKANEQIWTAEKRQQHSQCVPNRRPVIDNLGNTFESLTACATYHQVSRKAISTLLVRTSAYIQTYALAVWYTDATPKTVRLIVSNDEVYYLTTKEAAIAYNVTDKTILNWCHGRTHGSPLRWIDFTGVIRNHSVRSLVLESLRKHKEDTCKSVT